MSHFTLGVVNVGGGECRGGECRTILKIDTHVPNPAKSKHSPAPMSVAYLCNKHPYFVNHMVPRDRNMQFSGVKSSNFAQ